jgi:hypothetical protein
LARRTETKVLYALSGELGYRLALSEKLLEDGR